MTATALRRMYIRWLPLLLGATVIANFAILDWVPRSGQPLRTHPDASLSHLVNVEGVSLARTYGFYFAIAEAAEGAVVVLPEDSGLNADWLESLSGLNPEFRDSQIDTEVIDLLASGPPSGEVAVGEHTMSYWILDGQSDLWWIARTDQGLIVVPSSVAPFPSSS